MQNGRYGQARGCGEHCPAGSSSGPRSKVRCPKSGTSGSDVGPWTLDLQAERLLITVGGTREAIDPVRFISNHSSGKMGFAVAEAAAARGAEVTVVAGVTSVEPPASVNVIRVTTAEEMHAAVLRALPQASIFVAAAAVADYAPA